MRRPKSIRLLGKTYNIEWVKGLNKKSGHFGYCYYSQCLIEVAEDLPLGQQQDTLWHEILHGIVGELATDLKVESLALADKAVDAASEHEQAIESLNLKLLKAYEYEKGKRLNSETEEQWKKIVSPEGSLMGGFLARWKKADAGFWQTFIDGVKKNVGLGFDQIIELESGKVKK